MNQTSSVSGANIAYDIKGTGPALVLIHGAEGTRNSFGRVTPALSENFTVITYDQRDCGDTENLEEPASLEILALDIKHLLENLGLKKAHIYGTSFGGRVAQTFAVHHGAMVDRLVLASTWPASQMLKDINPEVALATYKLRQNLPESAELLAEYFFPPKFLEENPNFRDHFKKANPRSNRTERRGIAVSGFLPLDLNKISARTMLMAGDQDRLVPQELTLGMSKQIPDTETVIMEGVGHVSCVQSPDIVVKNLKKFLS